MMTHAIVRYSAASESSRLRRLRVGAFVAQALQAAEDVLREQRLRDERDELRPHVDVNQFGRKTRSILPAIKRALRARDGGCRFPGCDRTRFCDGHHVKHWADGGETKLGNLITLCGFHHTLLHEGGFGVAATDDGVFVFTRPDGSRIPDCGAAPKEGEAGRFRGIVVGDWLNPDADLTIDAQTSRCKWLGERMDYSMAIESMQFREEAARATTATPSCLFQKLSSGTRFRIRCSSCVMSPAPLRRNSAVPCGPIVFASGGGPSSGEKSG
jgi:hypothetical protein